MAGRKREKVRERDITGLKYFRQLLPLFERLHEVGCERDKAGNRRLHFDQYCSLILLFLFNPVVTSLRALQQASDDILTHYKVADFLEIEVEQQVTIRQVRKYRDRPARTEEKVRYQVRVIRREEAIEQAKQRLGWRVYATNAPVKRPRR